MTFLIQVQPTASQEGGPCPRSTPITIHSHLTPDLRFESVEFGNYVELDWELSGGALRFAAFDPFLTCGVVMLRYPVDVPVYCCNL
jgi:hypothetical protein